MCLLYMVITALTNKYIELEPEYIVNQTLNTNNSIEGWFCTGQTSQIMCSCLKHHHCSSLLLGLDKLACGVVASIFM